MALEQLVAKAERIGVIGSPSSTNELALDIMASAVNKKLVGELAFFPYSQDAYTNYALGQITEITLRNIWHEDPTMRSLIRQRGRVDSISERQDTHQGQMIISAVFANENGNYRPSILGTVPATGTPIYLADDDILKELLKPYQSQLFYLGHVYGSKPKLPLWFKHFDSDKDGSGAGEAYHLGIFGKTGSGKSVLAKMILLAYARYAQMGILVIDPQGEFAKEVKGEKVPGEFSLPTRKILDNLQKSSRVYSVRDIILDRWELLEQILTESRFFGELQILTRDKVELAASELVLAMKKANLKLGNLHERTSFDRLWGLLQQERLRNKIYAREGSAAERFADAISEANPNEIYQTIWLPVAELFREERSGARKVESLVYELFDPTRVKRSLVVIDLSLDQVADASAGKNSNQIKNADGDISTRPLWNETIQALVIKRLLEGIRNVADAAYKQNRSLNALVIIDEAHRIAPREEPNNDAQKGIRSILIDSARTTRKYGVGWMFISQTLSSLHREIVEQLRIFFFGFGLSMGAEFEALSGLVGGRSKALDLYKLFRDPHSSFDTASREYSFMTIGPVSPLSFAGTPLFFNAFSDVEDFIKSNGLITQSKML